MTDPSPDPRRRAVAKLCFWSTRPANSAARILAVADDADAAAGVIRFRLDDDIISELVCAVRDNFESSDTAVRRVLRSAALPAGATS